MKKSSRSIVSELIAERDIANEHPAVHMRLATVTKVDGTRADVRFGDPTRPKDDGPQMKGLPCFSAVTVGKLVVVLQSGNLAVVLGPAEGKV